MKFCKDCKYLAISTIDWKVPAWCEHPDSVSLVSGVPEPPCSEMRATICGPDAKLFEPKDNPA